MAVIRNLGLQDYESIWHNMQQFTQNRNPETPDEIWVVEHFPVYTLGLNGKREHVLLFPGLWVANTTTPRPCAHAGADTAATNTKIRTELANLFMELSPLR